MSAFGDAPKRSCLCSPVRRRARALTPDVVCGRPSRLLSVHVAEAEMAAADAALAKLAAKRNELEGYVLEARTLRAHSKHGHLIDGAPQTHGPRRAPLGALARGRHAAARGRRPRVCEHASVDVCARPDSCVFVCLVCGAGTRLPRGGQGHRPSTCATGGWPHPMASVRPQARGSSRCWTRRRSGCTRTKVKLAPCVWLWLAAL